MEIKKYKTGQVLAILKHCMRETLGNEAIDTSLSHNNIRLINRGNTAKEVNQYRKKLEKELYIMKRKDIIHTIELVAQCPSDCPETEKDLFFKETLNFVKQQFGLTGELEKYILLAEVHKDERVYIKTENVKNCNLDKTSSSQSINISKDHIHILFMPVCKDLKSDKHHNESGLKLNADFLTKKTFLKQLHPSYQEYLTSKKINATVYSKNTGAEKKIGLSVKQLKELTQKTGVVLNKSLSMEDLGNIIKDNIELKKELELAQEKIKELERTHEYTNNVWGKPSNSWGYSSWNNNRDIDIEK